MREPAALPLSRFKDIVARRLGIDFDADRLDFLGEVLRERLASAGRGRDGLDAYLRRLELGDPAELRVLAGKLTVSETHFFRYEDHFRAFVEEVLPQRMHARRHERALRVLSAGCASGEEAYSLAILLRENVPDFASWRIILRGFDVSPGVVQKARAGRYTAWSLRGVDDRVRARYFRAEEPHFVLEDEIRAMVDFDEANLVEDGPHWKDAGKDGAFDVVFCRNVTMYFTPAVMRSVIARIHRCLAPGGFFFLGHAESLRGVSSDFHLCHTHDTFYYQRRAPTGEASASERTEAPVTLDRYAEHAQRSEVPENESGWLSVIEETAHRISQLSSGAHAREARAPSVASAADLRPALDLLRQDRPLDALEHLGSLPAETKADSDAQLLKAVLLTSGGRLDEAEGICRAILADDELNAGAHYLAALCREHAGDAAAAALHDQSAIYLDGDFAMPHLHLGLLSRRSGDFERARSELARALDLLGREDAARVVLFGGGFRREALLDLCRAELRRCGGPA